VRRNLEALGVLDSPSGLDAPFGIDLAAMTDEQLDATLALMKRRQADGASPETERRGKIDIIHMDAPAPD
jgi:hypothetical protein